MKRSNAVILGAAMAAMLAGPALAAKTSFTMGMVLEPPHLDPTAGAAAAIDEVVYANVFEGLTRIDRNGEVKPALAESWTIGEDGKTYTFKLRSGATFHDGSAFDCEDVKFTIERAKAEDSVNAQKRLFAPISEVACPAPDQAVVTLSEVTGAFLFNMGWGDAIIVAAETAADNKTNPVGTGPFVFKRWVKGDRVELARNDAYWGDKPALESATFKFISDPSAATAALMAGDVDGFANFPAPESATVFEADPRFTVKVGTTEGETILAMNNAKASFDDIRVRRAITHALDRDAIIEGAMFGQGTRIGSHVAPHNPAYVDLSDAYPYDVDKAKALLAEAGLADGFTAKLMLPPPSYARRSGEVIAAQLGQVGIKVEIEAIEWAQWLDQVFKRTDFDMTIVSHTEPADIEIYARDKYYFNYANDAFKTAYAVYAATVDPEKAKGLLGDLQRMLSEDAVNVFLFQLPKLGIWNAKAQGLWENSPVQANDLTGVSWTE
ncbi:MAG: ABC transporter substrate-binding protein [Hyphomicrobiales bacterium]|nr:MAG: ABC transporter substrate-binding protein [Hyphomicrobiales bacterium]